MTIKKLLSHPLTSGLDIDDPQTTALRRSIILTKPFLKKLYTEWYTLIDNALPQSDAPAIELGSGGGFITDIIKNVITTDVIELPYIDRILDACAPWQFEDNSLRGVTMTNVFHHLPDVDAFLEEATRCIVSKGAIVMIEPWLNPWSRFVYKHIHHEPCDATVKEWKLPPGGPLSQANGALPWLVFHRDKKDFLEKYPQWTIEECRTIMPVSYILSGGVSMRSLVPGWLYSLVRLCEKVFPWGMFAFIVLRKN